MDPSSATFEVVLVRHGETSWSGSGEHTGTTDVPLIASGRATAREVGRRLATRSFARVITSPRSRAKETCELAGFGARAEVAPDVVEWDYGEYEGRTTAEIREERPGWTIWTGGAPGGETLAQIAARADKVIAALRATAGDKLLFSHAHFLRVLAARWIELAPETGMHLVLATGSISVLGWERETPAITSWNERGP